MKRSILVFCTAVAAGGLGMQQCRSESTPQEKASRDSYTQAQEIKITQGTQLDSLRAKYPKEWEVDIPKGTALDSLRQSLEGEFNILPEKDLEDSTPLPIWFRVYLRKNFPDLAKSGPYQYPRTAGRILQQMLAQPDSLNPRPR